MNIITNFINRYEIKIARIVTIIIFLALIRSIIEPLRQSMPWEGLLHLIIGCLIASIACLVITIFTFYSKYKAVIITGILTIIVLMIFKSVYMA